LGSRVRLPQWLWKTYVLYKTRNFFQENQGVAATVSQCGFAGFMMKNAAAMQHAVISLCELDISGCKKHSLAGHEATASS
jgi:hypothetical protein